MNSSHRNKDNNLFKPVKKNYSRYLIFFIGVVMLTVILVVIPQISKSNASVIKTNSLSARSVDEEFNPLTLVQCSDTNLAAIASFDVGSNRTPYSIVTGDFDGDGVPDLATPNLRANTVSVLKNTSNTSLIGFAACSDFTVGSRPYSIAKGDIDGDGKLDIIATNNSSNTVSILRNTSSLGTLSFTRSDFSVGTGPQAVEVGDIDGDGKLDLAVGNYSSKTVSILRNTSSSGSISFITTSNYTISTNPSSIAIEDIDGDGQLDLAVANYDYSANNLSVFRNTSSSGSISLAMAVNFSVGASPVSVTSGDIDGDGKKDLAIANSDNATVSLLRNTSSSGSISFATTSIAVGSSPRSVRMGDIDSDAKLDLVVANASSMTVSTLRNTSSSGSISFATSIDVSFPSTSRMAVIEDLDVDGKLDLAVLNSTQYTIWVLKNITTSSSINFLVASSFSAGTIPTSVAIGDLDGDGKADMAVTNQSSNNVSVFLNTSSSSASFTRTDFSVGNLPTSVAMADLDGDGKLDMAVTNNSSNTVSVLVNTSSTGSISFATATNFSVSTGPVTLAIGDLDGDGKSDLVVANFSSNNISVLRNTSTGYLSFSSPTNFSVGTSPINVAIGDIDGDGKFDVAVANQNSANISVLRNTSSSSSISFASTTNFSVPIVPRSIAIGDLDGDSKPDLSIATASSSNNKISVLRNTSSSGSISFATRIEFVVNLQPYSVVAVDVDGDGKLDLATANGATRTVSLLKNTTSTGTITFAYHNDFMVGNAPIAIGVADLDGNNKQDLAVVNAGSNDLTVLLNNCTPIP